MGVALFREIHRMASVSLKKKVVVRDGGNSILLGSWQIEYDPVKESVLSAQTRPSLLVVGIRTQVAPVVAENEEYVWVVSPIRDPFLAVFSPFFFRGNQKNNNAKQPGGVPKFEKHPRIFGFRFRSKSKNKQAMPSVGGFLCGLLCGTCHDLSSNVGAPASFASTCSKAT